MTVYGSFKFGMFMPYVHDIALYTACVFDLDWGENWGTDERHGKSKDPDVV